MLINENHIYCIMIQIENRKLPLLMYLSAHQATKKLGISSDTLRRWLKQGKITAKTSPSGTHLYILAFFRSCLPKMLITPPPPPLPKKDSSMLGSPVSSKK